MSRVIHVLKLFGEDGHKLSKWRNWSTTYITLDSGRRISLKLQWLP